MDDQSGIMGRSLHDRGHSYKQYVMKCTGCELTEHEEMGIMIIQVYNEERYHSRNKDYEE